MRYIHEKGSDIYTVPIWFVSLWIYSIHIKALKALLFRSLDSHERLNQHGHDSMTCTTPNVPCSMCSVLEHVVKITSKHGSMEHVVKVTSKHGSMKHVVKVTSKHGP